MSSFTSVMVGKGQYTSFWDGTQARVTNLKSIFPTLYSLAIDKDSNVAAFSSKPRIEENFRLPLSEQGLLIEISELMVQLKDISLSNSPDKQIWKWFTKNSFTDSSCYKFLKYGGIISQFRKIIQKLPIPEKCKIFNWLCFNNRLLTSEVLAKKGFTGPSRRTLCYLQEETYDHIFLNYSFYRIPWKSFFYIAAIHLSNLRPLTNSGRARGMCTGQQNTIRRQMFSLQSFTGYYGRREIIICFNQKLSPAGRYQGRYCFQQETGRKLEI